MPRESNFSLPPPSLLTEGKGGGLLGVATQIVDPSPSGISRASSSYTNASSASIFSRQRVKSHPQRHRPGSGGGIAAAAAAAMEAVEAAKRRKNAVSASLSFSKSASGSSRRRGRSRAEDGVDGGVEGDVGRDEKIRDRDIDRDRSGSGSNNKRESTGTAELGIELSEAQIKIRNRLGARSPLRSSQPRPLRLQSQSQSQSQKEAGGGGRARTSATVASAAAATLSSLKSKSSAAAPAAARTTGRIALGELSGNDAATSPLLPSSSSSSRSSKAVAVGGGEGGNEGRGGTGGGGVASARAGRAAIAGNSRVSPRPPPPPPLATARTFQPRKERALPPSSSPSLALHLHPWSAGGRGDDGVETASGAGQAPLSIRIGDTAVAEARGPSPRSEPRGIVSTAPPILPLRPSRSNPPLSTLMAGRGTSPVGGAVANPNLSFTPAARSGGGVSDVSGGEDKDKEFQGDREGDREEEEDSEFRAFLYELRKEVSVDHSGLWAGFAHAFRRTEPVALFPERSELELSLSEDGGKEGEKERKKKKKKKKKEKMDPGAQATLSAIHSRLMAFHSSDGSAMLKTEKSQLIHDKKWFAERKEWKKKREEEKVAIKKKEDAKVKAMRNKGGGGDGRGEGKGMGGGKMSSSRGRNSTLSPLVEEGEEEEEKEEDKENSDVAGGLDGRVPSLSEAGAQAGATVKAGVKSQSKKSFKSEKTMSTGWVEMTAEETELVKKKAFGSDTTGVGWAETTTVKGEETTTALDLKGAEGLAAEETRLSAASSGVGWGDASKPKPNLLSVKTDDDVSTSARAGPASSKIGSSSSKTRRGDIPALPFHMGSPTHSSSSLSSSSPMSSQSQSLSFEDQQQIRPQRQKSWLKLQREKPRRKGAAIRERRGMSPNLSPVVTVARGGGGVAAAGVITTWGDAPRDDWRQPSPHPHRPQQQQLGSRPAPTLRGSTRLTTTTGPAGTPLAPRKADPPTAKKRSWLSALRERQKRMREEEGRGMVAQAEAEVITVGNGDRVRRVGGSSGSDNDDGDRAGGEARGRERGEGRGMLLLSPPPTAAVTSAGEVAGEVLSIFGKRGGREMKRGGGKMVSGNGGATEAGAGVGESKTRGNRAAAKSEAMGTNESGGIRQSLWNAYGDPRPLDPPIPSTNPSKKIATSPQPTPAAKSAAAAPGSRPLSLSRSPLRPPRCLSPREDRGRAGRTFTGFASPPPPPPSL